MHAKMQDGICARMHIRMGARMYDGMCARMHSRIHAKMNARIHDGMCMRMHVRMNVRMHIRMHIRMHVRMHVRMHCSKFERVSSEPSKTLYSTVESSRTLCLARESTSNVMYHLKTHRIHKDSPSFLSSLQLWKNNNLYLPLYDLPQKNMITLMLMISKSNSPCCPCLRLNTAKLPQWNLYLLHHTYTLR